MRDPFKNAQLDPYEQELSDAIENSQVREVPDMEKEKSGLSVCFGKLQEKIGG